MKDNLLQSEQALKVIEQITIKNLKTGFGHDLAGMHCDVYFKGKKIAYFDDDGWGGETQIEYNDEVTQKVFEKFLADNNFAQLMLDNGWDFLYRVTEITPHDQANVIIEEAVNLINFKKFRKKIDKDCLANIVYGTDNCYSKIGFVGKMTLTEMVRMHKEKGVEAIQKLYDRIKANLEPHERILNNNLEELGIKL